MDTLALKDGDIFRWRWRDDARHANGYPWGSYHCKSQIAAVKNGFLYDTYWSSFDNVLSQDEVLLTHQCNSNEWSVIPSYQRVYYDDADIVDTRHPNNSSAPIYLRPGAKRSAEAISAQLAHKKERAEGDIRHAKWDLERVAEAEALVAAGKLDEVYL